MSETAFLGSQERRRQQGWKQKGAILGSRFTSQANGVSDVGESQRMFTLAGSSRMFGERTQDPDQMRKYGCSNKGRFLAEREGFEPSMEFPPRRFSRPVQSTALPPLRYFIFTTPPAESAWCVAAYLLISRGLLSMAKIKQAVFKTACFNRSHIPPRNGTACLRLYDKAHTRPSCFGGGIAIAALSFFAR